MSRTVQKKCVNVGLDTFLMQYIESEHSVLINNNRLAFTVKLEQYRGHTGGLSVGHHQDKLLATRPQPEWRSVSFVTIHVTPWRITQLLQ